MEKTFERKKPCFWLYKADATNSCGQNPKMKTEMYSATAEKML